MPAAIVSQCHPEFQQFHLTLYFIIETFSTVGYGDISPVTTPGRMVMGVLIIVMLVQVPVQISAIATYFEPGMNSRARCVRVSVR